MVNGSMYRHLCSSYGYDLNYNLTIPSKGVTTFTEHGQEWALDHFKNALGAKVIE